MSQSEWEEREVDIEFIAGSKEEKMSVSIKVLALVFKWEEFVSWEGA